MAFAGRLFRRRRWVMSVSVTGLAPGASNARILGLLARQGLRPVVLGLAAGLLALLGTGLIASFLHGIAPRDPIAIAFAVALLLVSAPVAVLIPARRAARLDPARVLRGA